MRNKFKSKINFVIDHRLLQEDRSALLVRVMLDEKVKYNIVDPSKDLKDDLLFTVVFCHEKSLRYFSKYKTKLLYIDSEGSNASDSVEKVNLNSYEEILTLLDKLFLIEKKMAIQSKVKDSEKAYEKLKIQNAQDYTDDLSGISKEQRKDLDHLLELEVLLLSTDSLATWNSHFKNFSKKHSLLHTMLLLNSEELLSEEIFYDESVLLFNLPLNEYFLLLKFKGSDDKVRNAFIELLITMLLRTLQVFDQQLIKNDGEIDFWKKIFSKIPYPMAVISNLGDLLIYNESFAKIGILPKECLRFKDQESLEIFQQFYKVRRIEFPIKLSNVSYFVFYSIENRQSSHINLDAPESDRKGRSKSNVDELGIISSSIAHELNNPLAGILAALSLLSLDDGWSKEDLVDLDDMKNGAKRCKELVEIFLGFSKFSPAADKLPSIKDSLDQAINLLRFRMIESNLRLDIKYVATLENFSHQINSSIMSMILYLIISELMTAFAHERLITQVALNSMSGEVFEFSNQIIMKLDYNFEYEEKLAQSKLLQHLLVFEKLEINFLKKEIRLIYRS